LFLFLAAALAQDARDLLARGSGLIASKPAEAVRLLEQAVRLDPALPGLHYQLGLAYHAIGDEADAAAAFRDALGEAPDSAGVHNCLGIALFQMGDAKAALEEFRAAARLAPKDPNAHFNLGEAMARTGDSSGAVAELRVATSLAPGDASLTRLLQTVETRLTPEGTIKVEVRQVLVPVVVTDSQGHHLTGLTQADFKVFEDGVEQKITAFSVERSGIPQTPAAQPAAAAPVSGQAPSAAAQPARPRRTYIILIDTLNTSFRGFSAAREALVKLFRQEQSADSQYVAIALGAEPEMVVNVTPNASAVLAALESKRMQKIFLDGRVGSLQPEMEHFTAGLNETRAACDQASLDSVLKIKCAAGLERMAQQARQVSELEETILVGFLRQFRSIVAQLARARDRRTILLVSDGFTVEPGRAEYSLMNGYFPAASHCLIPSDIYCPPSALQSVHRMSEEFDPILKLAAAGNITIDTIDSRGTYGQKTFDAESAGVSPAVDGAVGRAQRDVAAMNGNTLREIAAATGGTAWHDDNDLLGGMERAFADGRDYYTLAYVSGNADYDGKFRAITVKVRDPKAVVNAKRGYWAAPGAQ